MFETEKQNLELQQKSQPPPLIQELPQNSSQLIPSLLNVMQTQNRNDVNLLQNMFNNQSYQNQPPNFPIQQQPSPQQLHHQQQDINNQFQNFNLPPPAFSIPDLSRPPPLPGIARQLSEHGSYQNTTVPPPADPIEEADPQPYFTLPAGVMVPLIGLEDFSYCGIDPELIKLPPPTPPHDKLLSAVEAFYSAPCHERPRDTEGWEKIGLYEYFKIKNSVKKNKEEEIARGERDKPKSPSPIPESLLRPVKKQKKRVYHSKSPEPRSSKSKSRSPSPELRPTITPTVNRNRSRKRSRSPSPSPYRNFNRDTTRIDRRKRSVTPPSFMGAAAKVANDFIDEGNKGHQMLKKLGWTSGGLGAGKNQGIVEPISGGELRDRNDLYKVCETINLVNYSVLRLNNFSF